MRVGAAVPNALRAVLPGPLSTTFLRACVDGGEAGRRAWASWRAGVGDVRSGLRSSSGVKPLAPLLHQTLSAWQAPLEREEMTVLRTAAVRAELRHATFLSVVGPAIEALAGAGVETVVFGDAALAGGTYPAPALRHCHDLDLLVSPGALERARAVLAPLGWSGPPGTARVVHPSGAALELHARPLRLPQYELSADDLRAQGTRFQLGVAPARMPSPTDMLVLVCVNAVSGANPSRLEWVPDSWFILNGATSIDWARVTTHARGGRLALPLSVTLSYLARELGLAVPRETLEELAALAGREDAIASEVALSLAFRAHRAASTRPRPRAALTFARWALLPSPAYLRSTGRVRRWPELPLAYAERSLRAARQAYRIAA